MARIRIQRLEKELLKIISRVINYKLRDENLQWITISDIKLSNDISNLKIYYTFLGDIDKDAVQKSLQKSAGFIKNEIAAEKMMRKIPQLNFFYDELDDKARKIDNILKKIKNERK